MKRETHKIDATDRPLGRLAVEVSLLLRGKNKPDWAPNKEDGDFVVVENFSKVKLTGKKREQKMYYQHSGFIGGLTEIPLEKLWKEKPDQVLVRAVLGMMPKNKLRARQIKRLKVEM